MCPSFKTCHRSPLLLYSQLPRPPSLSFCTGQAACSKSNLLLKKFFFGAVPQLFDTAVYIYTQQTPRPDLVSQYKEPCGLQGWLSYLRTTPRRSPSATWAYRCQAGCRRAAGHTRAQLLDCRITSGVGGITHCLRSKLHSDSGLICTALVIRR